MFDRPQPVRDDTTYGQPSRRPAYPSRWVYLIAVGLLVYGLGIIAWPVCEDLYGMATGEVYNLPGQANRVIAPGRTTLHLLPDEYLICFEPISVVDGKPIDSGHLKNGRSLSWPFPKDVVVRDAEGNALELFERDRFSYEFNSGKTEVRGFSRWGFTVRMEGDYTVEVESEPGTTWVVFPDFRRGMGDGMLSGMAWSLGGLALALLTLLLRLLTGRKPKDQGSF